MKRNKEILIGCIIALVGAFAFYSYRRILMQKENRIWMAESDVTLKAIDNYSFLIIAFEQAKERLPNSTEEMATYLQSVEYTDWLNKQHTPRWAEVPETPYTDAWGTELAFILQEGHPKYEFLLLSAGRDREFGTQDDIKSWRLKKANSNTAQQNH